MENSNPPPPATVSRTNRIINPNPNPNQNLDPDPTQSQSQSQSQSPQNQVQLEEVNHPPVIIRYRECLKNHAANMGGHVTDGCGEFMSSGEEGTSEALRCAACDCHRNFHRKDTNNNNTTTTTSSSAFYPTPSRHGGHSLFTMPSQQHQHKLPHNYFYAKTNTTTQTAPIMMSFGVYGAAGESSSEDLNMYNYNIEGQGGIGQTSSSKKRFRTKFTQEQKEKMHVFAEKVGWKIQKQDEQELKQFCDELGIKRQVFKVWMHNNKQAMKKKEI